MEYDEQEGAKIDTADIIFEWAEEIRNSKSPDYFQMLFWYRLAGQQGHAGALNNLGTMYQNGLGVKQNFVEAASLYRQAAELGDATAQFNLAMRYKRGEGVTADPSESDKWLEMSADQGHLDAICALATAYQIGDGRQKDVIKAGRLYLRAAEQGDLGARVNLMEMTEELQLVAILGVEEARLVLSKIRGSGLLPER